METTIRIIIQGRVQGVGFRPFVYRKARALGIRGSVTNTGEGVLILATGPPNILDEFYTAVTRYPPPVAQVVRHSREEIAPEHPEGFSIVPTAAEGGLNLQLTPDFALCESCATELKEVGNHRKGYPFISCVACGPRWALTETFPFEREHTSMSAFTQCPACLAEYGDPEDRRFHSQTNSCPQCGIACWLADPKGNKIAQDAGSAFRELAIKLAEGSIIALKNTSGYLLCCDARQGPVVSRLRNRKQRPSKPFAVLYPSMEQLREDLEVSPAEAEALHSPERPIVLLSSAGYRGEASLEAIAPGLNQLGVMLPYTGVLAMLATAFPHPLVATSGNLHGSPICFSEAEAMEKLSGVADFFFGHNLAILHPQDDSVVRMSASPPGRIVLRRSRGMAPNYSKPVDSRPGAASMALGAHLKSSVACIPNDFLYVSQYLGNLDNFEVYQRFTQTVDSFVELFGQRPKTLLVDGHPSYLSHRYGRELSGKWEVTVREIQHHKAHFAAVLAEHGLFVQREPVLGVIWDGTGYGEDGQVWGGEFFRYQEGVIARTGQLDYFDWLAGDKMAREPRLSLLSLLGPGAEAPGSKFSEGERQLYAKLLHSNTLKTSSMGRVFDAVSSLLGYCDLNTFEGEAAMRLETACRDFSLEGASPFVHLNAEGNIPAKLLVQEVARAKKSGRPGGWIAGNFIFTLANLILEKAERESVRKVACSGGVFQNALLLDMLHRISPRHLEWYFHREFSPNDENVSFGQLMFHLNCT
ncbi:carbamoyltransferase HypF [Robiginitalea marina]|uniref:Carbamoyltransferase n=1 Tax=Robiginitalea marina TaxID=2954105 RepID=A0ABT1AZU1_9FLAO|nr:carbamoyltransferase HypF [Robiginitalea marina]MCO5725568.1 carbamoyltransferase HypF [Robiginitalea marina]